jgi:pyruvate dehydrogenase E1 component
LLAATVPNVRAYEVAYAYELAAVIEDGLRRMFVEDENVVFYLTLQNESYPMPAMPEGARAGILRGIYRFRAAEAELGHRVQLFGSGAILNEVLRAQQILAERYQVAADVWSVTSYQQLRDEAVACERHAMLHPEEEAREPYLSQVLQGVPGPYVAASDYVKLHVDRIARWIPGRLVPLGTDGFGMSDTREALRRHFEVDAETIALAALHALSQERRIEPSEVARAIGELGIEPDKIAAISV